MINQTERAPLTPQPKQQQQQQQRQVQQQGQIDELERKKQLYSQIDQDDDQQGSEPRQQKQPGSGDDCATDSPTLSQDLAKVEGRGD
jgi:hypothetical protein